MASDRLTAAWFWLAATLPIAYVPVFLAGVDSIDRLLLVVSLLGVNALALVLGHDYPAAGDR